MTTTWDPEAFTRALIEELRTNDGKVSSGPLAGKDLLILTTRGAKTGAERVAILTYSRDGDDYIVAGSAAGAPTNPAWLANLRANPDATVEAGGKRFDARATVTTGAERDRLWERHVNRWPEFAEYPEKSGRVIPIVRLTAVK